MSKLYPPYVESTIPAQATMENGGRVLHIPFRLNRAVSLASVAKICARIKTVSTNSWLGVIEVEKDINNVYPDTEGTDYYYVDFTETNSELTDIVLDPGQHYKIQLAFIDVNGLVGYYSSVGVFKYTTQPSVYIEGLEDNNLSNLYTYVGVYSQAEDGQDPTEKIYSYQFDLYEGSTIVATSGLKLHDSTQDESSYESRDIWVLNQQLSEGVQHQIQYSITTINGYKASTPKYTIWNNEFDYDADNSIKPYLKFENNFENGYIRLFFNNNGNNFKSAGGGFIISRASSEDNYATWYDVMRFTLAGSDTSLPEELFKDFSVVQGVGYKYALQRYNDSGFYTSRLPFSSIEDNSTIAIADFEDMFLYDGTRQLKVRFNPKVTSFKTTVLESKTNTIGGKYPFIFRNGNVRYKEFSISGLISYLADTDELFMSNAELGFVEEHAHRHATEHDEVLRSLTRSAHVDSINMAAERTFKLSVLEWLTNGKPKLFRSPGEGNYIINLMNVSLSPNDTVARMLHTFSSQACEIADYNFENLMKYGFIEDKCINNEVLVFETIDFKGSAQKAQVAQYSINYIQGYEVYFAEFRDMTPGAIFTLKFLNGKGDLTIQIPYNGGYFVNIFNTPLVSVVLKSLPAGEALTGYLDIGYYSTTGVGDFGDVRKVVIGDQSYTQYGRCDGPKNTEYNKYYDSGNNTIDALEDRKFKTGYFYYLAAETRYSQSVLYESNGKYYDDRSMEASSIVEVKDLNPQYIYTIKNPATDEVIHYIDGNTQATMSYPSYVIQIQLNNSDKLETINLGNYDSAGRYILPALSTIKKLMVGSGVWIECVYQEKEYIYAVEEDNEVVVQARQKWLANGAQRPSEDYDALLAALDYALLNK